MRPARSILTSPVLVPHRSGIVRVLKTIGETQKDMGEALTLDSIVGSCDAEVIAVGPSDKGPGRGAILRHGPYTLWGFGGTVDDLTLQGRMLFVNVVAYASRQRGRRVLETRRNGTRDDLLGKIAFARRSPGYLRTIKRLYVPESLADATLDEIEIWVKTNRPYLRTNGRRLEVDAFAQSLGIPNHRRALLEWCIVLLRGKEHATEALATLRRYTGEKDLGPDSEAWKRWYDARRDFMHFSDCEGFRFLVDEEARADDVPFEERHDWSSEAIDYRPDALLPVRSRDRPR